MASGPPLRQGAWHAGQPPRASTAPGKGYLHVTRAAATSGVGQDGRWDNIREGPSVSASCPARGVLHLGLGEHAGQAGWSELCPGGRRGAHGGPSVVLKGPEPQSSE